MKPVFYTIGHSNRSVDAFIGLLEASGVRGVADVRAFAHSRAMPQFEGEALRATLAARGLAYRNFPALGGRRPAVRDVPRESNAWWENRSFHNYADYATTPVFRAGLAELMAWDSGHPAALMCAEAVWWRCHRRIVADYLMAAGCTVFHILGENAVKPAELTPVAVARGDGALLYPAAPEPAP